MDDDLPARPLRSVFFAFLAGILPGVYLWFLLIGPPAEAQANFGLALVVYFVLGGFVGYLGRAPVWAATLALLTPAMVLLLWHAWAVPEDGRALPILGVVVVIAFATAYGGKRYRKPKDGLMDDEAEAARMDAMEPATEDGGHGSEPLHDVDASRQGSAPRSDERR